MNYFKNMQTSSFGRCYAIIFVILTFSFFGFAKEQKLQSYDQIVVYLQSQLQNQLLADDVDLNLLAHKLHGSDCVTIQKSIKRALYFAQAQAKKSKLKKSAQSKITMAHFSEAIDDVLYGHHNKVLDFFVGFTLAEKTRAFHESGHGLIGVLYLDSLLLVDKITIAARANTGGHCGFLELSDDPSSHVSQEVFDMYIVMLLAGGVAEQLSVLKNINQYDTLIAKHFDKYFNDFINKSSIGSDLEKAKSMLLKHHSYFAVHELLRDYYKKTVELLLQNKNKLQKLAQTLMVKKTMYSDEIYKIVGVTAPLCDFQKV